jgi:NhaA family Na+:H+ antiporter
MGLVVGKPIGIALACWLAVRTGIASLPQGATWQHMIGTGVLAGIGFTMSIFIASLAFADADMLATAKLSILAASALAGGIGMLLLSRVKPTKGH